MNIQIAQLDRTLPDSVVSTIHWTASQTDGDYTASAYGSLGVPAKDPSDPTFIQFALLQWAKSKSLHCKPIWTVRLTLRVSPLRPLAFRGRRLSLSSLKKSLTQLKDMSDGRQRRRHAQGNLRSLM
jgi:hypothetical protein